MTLTAEEYKEQLHWKSKEELESIRDACLDTVKIINEILEDRYWNS